METPLAEMNALSVNYHYENFPRGRKALKRTFPPRTLYGMVADIRHFLAEKKPDEDINPLITSDKRYDLVISTKARA